MAVAQQSFGLELCVIPPPAPPPDNTHPDFIMAATAWPTNAHLIADVASLYIPDGALVVDVTYGLGNWWTLYRPSRLVAHDIDPKKGDGVDFRELPEPDDTYDVAAFDPPYMAPGGRKLSTTENFNDRFGLHTTPATPALNQEMINDGLTELARVVKPRGVVLVKCMDYVNGGALFPGAHLTLSHALAVGFTYVDRLEHVGRMGPQPTTNRDGSPRRQIHARRNLSTLLVLRAPAPTRKAVA